MVDVLLRMVGLVHVVLSLEMRLVSTWIYKVVLLANTTDDIDDKAAQNPAQKDNFSVAIAGILISSIVGSDRINVVF